MKGTKIFDKRIAIGVILGNTLAWADFSLYAYFSPILSRVFFPFTTEAEGYILYFIVFALGFVFRPIGSMIAGAYADQHGRKNTLLATVIISSIITTLIGCLPSYNVIGFFSPFLLTILRILQTMSISAEPTNSGSLLIEHAPKNKKGFIASCVMVGVFLGFLFGIFSFFLVSYFLTLDQISAWGWRLPFLASMGIGVLVAFFLQRTKESPLFLQKYKEGKIDKHPIRNSFRYHYKAILFCFGYSLLMAVGNYFLLGFIPNFLTNTLGIDLKVSNLFITISVLISTILIPIAGFISDKIGRKPILMSGALGFIIFIYPIMWLMSSGNNVATAIALILYGIILAPTASVLPVAIAEMLPFAVRCTASTIGYNAALTLFGGTTPIIAQFLIWATNKETSPFIYIIFIAIIHLLFVLSSEETKDRDVSV